MSIPTADYPLRDYAVNLYAQCKAHKAEWGLSEAALAALKERVDDYCANLAACRKPDQRESDSDSPPRDEEALPRVRIGTDTPEVFEFRPEERNKQARFQAAWINEWGCANEQRGKGTELRGRGTR